MTMPQQKGAKRAKKVLVRKRKLEERAREANFKKLESQADQPTAFSKPETKKEEKAAE